MGERADGLNTSVRPTAAHEPSPSRPVATREPGEIERDIESLRAELGELVGELDRRRHEAFDLRLQLRRHASLIVAVAALGGVVVFAAYGVSRYARRRRAQPQARAQDLARVLAILARHPGRVERMVEWRSLPATALSAALGRIAAAVGERTIRRATAGGALP